MWSWKHIKRHRQQVKQYKELYKTKITNKKPADTLLKTLEVNSGDVGKSFFTIGMKRLSISLYVRCVRSGAETCKLHDC